jgi:uncharacterized protein YbbC (DUF1343 family)
LAQRVTAQYGSAGIPGACLRPLTFSPTFHKHVAQRCLGVQVHVTDAGALRSYELYLRLIAEAKRLCPGAFRWRTETYEFVSDRPAIDLLTGGSELRTQIDAGGALDELLTEDRAGVLRFAAMRAPHLMY